ncbi:MAG: proton-conducting transporter membrane subunit [Elusimicrobiales bacterium]|nr:proton-conducting transporter membrane subunit [Elusimicrobiales bacterium]
MTRALLLLPLAAGLLAFVIRSDSARRSLLLWTARIHFLLALVVIGKFIAGDLVTVCPVVQAPAPELASQWFAYDPLGLLFLGVTSLLFLGASQYAVTYLAAEKRDPGEDADGGFIFNNAPEAVFTGCLLLFLSAMTAVTASRHLGLLWAFIEATTLLSAPLIYFHRHKRSLEATWKYLLICSVGIALALLGNLFLGAAGLKSGVGLDLAPLLAGAGALDKPLLKAAFLFLFVGYGTKMGLSPFHTWLPDAHSEAPAVVSALLSGALLNCAFLGVMRVNAVCAAAGLAEFTGGLLVLFGLLSVITAALFMLGQRDYKRLLAYSSIEHMGIIALGAGLGGGAVFGALLAALSHSLAKAGLFFTSGLILAAEKTKRISEVKGLWRRAPRTAALWLAGFFLITGTPPSGVFLAKFIVLKEILALKHYWLAGAFLLFLGILFAGMARVFISMTFGEREARPGERPFEEQPGLLWPAAAFFACVVLAGLYLPAWLQSLLAGAAGNIGGKL